jgi:hypothetical protein
LRVSGGEEGALLGPSIMPGGFVQSYDTLGPIFESIAARVDDTPCCIHVGPDGAGHHVKMERCSADGRAEPRWHLAEEICLVFAGPGHVTVRPQQHGGYIQFLAAVDDVVDPVGPPGDRESAGSVEE